MKTRLLTLLLVSLTSMLCAQSEILPLFIARSNGPMAQGDLFYHNGTRVVRLPAGTSGYFLKTQGTGLNPIWAAGGGGAGTVTSVALTMPGIFSVSGSPITESGTLAASLAAQTANTVFAGPTTGSAAAPAFRALVAADLPDLSGVYQPLSSSLTAFAELASAAGVLTNNGSGTMSYTATSTGGNGTDDSGKIAKFNYLGQLAGGFVGTFDGGPSYNFVAIAEGLSLGSETNSGTFGVPAAGGTSLVWTLPSVTGTLVSTGDTGSITNTMLAGSIAPAKLNVTANVQSFLGSADYAAMRGLMSLGNVENTALSTWTGSTNITTLGTVGVGTWQGGAIDDAYIASAAAWSAKEAALTFSSPLSRSGNTISLAASGITAGSYGSTTQVARYTIDTYGRITAVSAQTIQPAISVVTGLGTGVATALAIPVGSAGAPVLYNGDAGTPSAITLTNASGTAASLTAGLATAANGLQTATTTVSVYAATAPTSGQVLTATSSTTATWQTLSGSGTVTSVAASVPAFLSVSGSPITSSGTLAITLSGTALPIANGGTGGTTAADARTALGLGTLATQSGTFSGSSSGTNTGDQTAVSGNAGTATALATGRTLAITGDLDYTSPTFDGSANVTAAGTLATVNSNVGSFGNATAAPSVTVNAKGLVTGVTTATITPAESSVTFTDITTNDATTAKHGYLPKLPGGTTAFLRADGAFATPAGGSGGKLAQRVCTEDATQKTSTATIPWDDTLPQSTEGSSYDELNVVITPTNASSTLYIEVQLTVFVNSLQYAAAALFRDSETDCLATNWVVLQSAGYPGTLTIRKKITAGSTSAQTFKVRFGRISGTPTIYLNDYTTSYFGGSQISSMTVTEILP